MAKVRLTNRPLNGRAMRINFGTDRYVVGYKQDVDIPLKYASSLLQDSNYTVVLDSSVKNAGVIVSGSSAFTVGRVVSP